MSSDGLTDLVRIRNGEVCYWPNLGYGRFGAKVTMDSSPWFDWPDQFDQKRIRLADIDGSGTTDIIYLHAEGVRLYFNQSGNSWSKPQQLAVFPPTDNLTAVHTTDLLGNGTACLVWSSPLSCHAGRQMRYVNLMGGQKPHLLVKTVNNLGAETHVYYAPSTQFYLQDKLDGRPWITKLPFPVHVVERVATFDRISRSRFVSRYAYHHGYFDGVEREFRGFGMVEQWDTEEIGNIPSEDLAVSTNLDAASFVPPVHTKTWFHNGAHLAQNRISQIYTHEYYQEDAQAVLLPDTVLPAGLTAEEEREACRALKGSILRQEIYAEDGTDKSPHPYSVSERNYAILPVQRKGGNRHAVFFAHPLETIDYHYERSFQSDPEPDARKKRKIFDPRISHSMTLAVDDFGNVLHAAALAYPRRQPAFAEQAQVQITCTENQVANRPDELDWYRVGVAVATRTYEITGLPSAVSPFSLADFRTRLAAATLIAYEAEPTAGVVQKRLIEQVRTLYRHNADADTVNPAPLPLGVIESLALPCESFKLAFTPGLLTQIYDSKMTAGELDTLLADEGGYSQQDGGWWIPSGRQALAPEQFYLPVQTRDPFGNIHVTEYDAYRLSVIRSVDPLGNTVLVRNNYRTLQPEQLTDPNGNRSQVRFDALGMVVGTAVMGKKSELLGDSFADFKADLSPEEIETFFAADNPRPLAVQHLGTASTRIIYDLDCFRRSGKPACAAAIARETHVSDLKPNEVSKAHLSFVYSDGFGREAQTKTQAEPGPIVEGGPVVNSRWVGTGAKIYNNKGKPVRQYEPFFSPSHQFGIEQWGVSSTLFYDPAERVVATLHPNQTWEKVVFDPWQQTTWDVNDTVLLDPRTDEDVRGFFLRLPEAEYWPSWHGQRMGGAMGPEEKDAAKKTARHAGTPTAAHFDSLGRAFLTIADNGGTEKFRTHVALDIEGNQRAVTDALGRVVMRYGYDMLGSRLHQASMEAGERWTLNDAAGKPLRTWDSRGFSHRMEYDALRRPVAHYVSDNGQIEKMIYGDTPGALANPEQNNHRGKPYQVFDSAGVVVSEEFDFKGNLLRSSRQLPQDYKGVPDWSAQPALEEEIFSSSTRYDALNRPIQLTAPRSNRADSTANVIQPAYNEAKLLERVHVWQGKTEEPAALLDPATASFQPVTNIDYDAKGQRSRIAYGNGTTSDYAYDEKTFRLTQLKTTRAADGARLQDLRYAYDPAGNITRIRDEAQQTVFFRNQAVEPHCDYSYDALYRLISAEGREHIGQTAQPESSWNDEFRIHQPHPHDGQALRRYLERYLYDAVGNFAQLEHQADNGNWTRSYAYEEASLLEQGKVSNRLSKTILHPNGNSPVVEPYSYDAHGNMTRMPHLPLMAWDFRDQLCASSRQAADSGTPETTYYVYDGSGQRVRKVTESYAAAGGSPAKRQERIYLGGFEVYREWSGLVCDLERLSLHVMDGKQRIALVETKTLGQSEHGDALNSPLVRYQLGNHLGSASLELDRDGALISYEEYHPYGTTAIQLHSSEVSRKRYRYTGMERDEETGLNYHSARYYAGWLGRWCSCDPIGIKGGLNVYEYGYDSPTLLIDPSGEQPPPRQASGTPQQTRLGQFVERVRAGYQGGRTCSPTSPALETVQQILSETAQHFGAIQFGSWIRTGPTELGDTGFRPALQDPWVQSRYQVGHFLTAVGHAMNGIDSRLRAGIAGSQLLRASPFGGAYERAAGLAGQRIPETSLWELDIGPGILGTALGSYWSDALSVDMQSRAYAIWVDVGHEARSDAEGPAQQVGTITQRDIQAFQTAVNQISHDPNATVDLDRLSAALAPLAARLGLSFEAQAGRQGNSFQDLMLTALGYGFADMLRQGVFTNNQQAANWLERNLGSARSAIDYTAGQLDKRPGNEEPLPVQPVERR